MMLATEGDDPLLAHLLPYLNSFLLKGDGEEEKSFLQNDDSAFRMIESWRKELEVGLLKETVEYRLVRACLDAAKKGRLSESQQEMLFNNMANIALVYPRATEDLWEECCKELNVNKLFGAFRIKTISKEFINSEIALQKMFLLLKHYFESPLVS